MKTPKNEVIMTERQVWGESLHCLICPRTCRVTLSQVLLLAGSPLAQDVFTEPVLSVSPLPRKLPGEARGQGESTGQRVRGKEWPAGLSPSLGLLAPW